MAEVSLSGVTKRFGADVALDNVTMTIPDGSFVVLLGPTGAGKTTTLRMVSGLDVPDAGHIMIGGRDMTGLTPAQRDVAMVFQQYSLYPHMTVRENLEFPLKSPILKTPQDQIRRKVNEIADILQIRHKLDNKATELSGGEMQRVSIGRALVRKPSVYLMDEPLSSLDAKLRADLRVELKSIQADSGATLLYVTHDQIEAMTLASRIAVMKDGILQQFDTPQNIYERPNNMFVAGFIGSPSMNFIDATLSEENGKLAITIPRNGNPIVLPLFEAPESYRGYIGKDVVFGIRPEALTHKRTGSDEPGSQYVNFDSKVEVIEPTGADTMTVIEIAGKEIVARVRPDRQPKPGESMTFSADMSQISLFDPDTELRI